MHTIYVCPVQSLEIYVDNTVNWNTISNEYSLDLQRWLQYIGSLQSLQ